MEMKRLIWLASAFFVPLIGVFCINALVDPYIYWHNWSSERWEPAFLSFDREVHMNLVAHVHPRSLLLGNSQTQYGLDPAHWAAPAPVINASAVGVSLSDVRQMLDFSLQGGPLDTVIVGLDYSLTYNSFKTMAPIFAEYVVQPNGGIKLGNIKSYFSFTVLKSSLQGIHKFIGLPRMFATDGHALDQLYVQSVRAAGGARASLLFRLNQFKAMLNKPEGEYKSDLRAIRDETCNAGGHLTIYLAPLHAILIEVIAAHGQEAEWNQWKRDIVTILHERPECPVAVWDFNYYNKFTTEPLPDGGQDASMRYSWDGVHFRQAVGDMILARMTGAPMAGDDAFGFLLTPETLDAALASEETLRAEFISSHPDEVRNWTSL